MGSIAIISPRRSESLGGGRGRGSVLVSRLVLPQLVLIDNGAAAVG